MNVSDLINTLQAIQAEHGDVPVLMRGYNDYGHVAATEATAESCYCTGAEADGDVRRALILEKDREAIKQAVVGPAFFVAVIE